MKTNSREIFLAAVLFFALAMLARATPVTTQTVRLQPGWNSVWLELAPTNADLNVVFAGVPIDSVWTFQRRISSVDFIQDPSEPVWNRNSWRVYLPTNRFESFHNNLFTLQANRAYLIKLNGNATVTLNVVGRPPLQTIEWAPDAYNLRGFPVDPALPPTFLRFFRPSAAHYNATLNQLQNIYRLDGSGEWMLVGAGDLMRPGEAYWVFTKGASDYSGPFGLRLDFGDGLDYGKGLPELSLLFKNFNGTTMVGTIRDLAAPAANPLSYFQFKATNFSQWINLPSPRTLSVPAASELNYRLALRRKDLSGKNYETVLAVTDGQGTRYLVPVSAGKIVLPTAPGGGQAGEILSQTEPEADHVGLWVGTATINAVSEPHSGILVTNATTGAIDRIDASTNTSPVATEFKLRLLLHVDASGVTRLLREVYQLWQDGTYKNDADGLKVLERPGRFVLVTDETLLPQFQGATLRDGREVGRRLSTIGFDFPTTQTDNFLLLDGLFAVNNSLNGTISLAPDFPTNPFRHKFHPDHNNLDENYRLYREEAYRVTRNIQLQFTAMNTFGPPVSDYGYNVIAGIYRENISGLHKTNIYARGLFQLQRVAVTGDLNPRDQNR